MVKSNQILGVGMVLKEVGEEIAKARVYRR